jgi:rod shape-determining protein MreC
MAVPLKVVVQRFALLFLVLAAFGLMLLSKAETIVVERVSAIVVDVFAPIIDFASRPAAGLNEAVRSVRELAALREENERLRRENIRLLAWQEAARRLAAQRLTLEKLLEFKPDPRSSYITARVIGDSGGAFVRSLLVNAGSRDNVAKGQAVVTGQGLVGRIAGVGLWSARALLITDINSRVPVMLEKTRERAILAGDNSARPRLTFLPGNVEPRPGDRVVTSGHGGVFPPGLAVGRVIAHRDSGIRVQPFARLTTIEFVRIVNYAGISDKIPADSAGDGAGVL